jgi:2-hydroxychromene-2-carboxylate isomerase
MTPLIELFYDFRSPYSYLAFNELQQTGVNMTLKPMNLPALMEKVGNVPTSLTCAAKGRYSQVDVGRWAQRYNISLNPADMDKVDGEACLCAVLAATSPADAAAISLALYRACWGEGNTLATKDDILAAITAAGIDATPIAEQIDAPDVIAQLDANTNEAAERGAFGSPTIFVGEAMFFGNDRLDFVRDELALLEKAA